jgi:alkylhydroperoxidase family enzyme
MRSAETTEASKESPALLLIRLAYEVSRGSTRRTGYAVSHAVKAAIDGMVRFNPGDLTLLSKHSRDGGISLQFLIGTGCAETWYDQAVGLGHATAMTAIERWIGRPRFVFEGKVLCSSSQVRLASAITEENPGGHVHVSSFSDDGKFVNFSHEEIDHEQARCVLCRSYDGREDPKPSRIRRYRLSWKELDRLEKARAKVASMSFESPGTDPALREFAGRLIAEQCRGRILDIAKLELGESIEVGNDVGERVTLRRIAYVTHDALDKAHGSYGHHVYGDDAEARLYRRMLADGLVRFDGSCYFLTDAGAARLTSLTAAAINALRLAEEDRESARRQPSREYTAAELATVVTVADSAQAGNCETGTAHWIARHAPGRTEMTVKELLALDGGRNRFNVSALIRAGLARAARPPVTS